MTDQGRATPLDRRRVLAHARPVTAAARRQADRAGVPYTDAPREHEEDGAFAGVPRVIGSLGRSSAHRGRWLAIPLVVVVAGVVVVAAASPFDPGLARSAGVGAASPSPAPSQSFPDAASPASSVVPSVTPSLAPPGLPTGYRWPLDHARITAWFGPRPDGLFLEDGTKVHDGLDIATFCGDRIEAAHDGVVLVAGRRVDDWLGWVGDVAPYHARLDAKHLWGSRAIMVIVDDGDGYRSVYVHLAKAIVRAGQHVLAGDLLGYEGATGDATGCHLHYSLFSPTATAVFQTDPAAVKRYALPPGEIARIDPLLVLPPMESADVTWGWGARG